MSCAYYAAPAKPPRRFVRKPPPPPPPASVSRSKYHSIAIKPAPPPPTDGRRASPLASSSSTPLTTTTVPPPPEAAAGSLALPEATAGSQPEGAVATLPSEDSGAAAACSHEPATPSGYKIRVRQFVNQPLVPAEMHTTSLQSKTRMNQLVCLCVN